MKIFRKFKIYSIGLVFLIATLKMFFDLYSAFFGEQKLLFSNEEFSQILSYNQDIKECALEVKIPDDFTIYLSLKDEKEECKKLFFEAVSRIFAQSKVRKQFLKLAKENSSFGLENVHFEIKKSEKEIDITLKKSL